MREKPEMILEKGKLTLEGSGGDHDFVFRNDDIPPATLTIKKGSKVILIRNAKIIRE